MCLTCLYSQIVSLIICDYKMMTKSEILLLEWEGDTTQPTISVTSSFTWLTNQHKEIFALIGRLMLCINAENDIIYGTSGFI